MNAEAGPARGAADGVRTVLAACVVGLTGVVLGTLPSTRALRLDHALIPALVDELAGSALVVLAAVAAAAGGVRWTRWAAVTLALHALAAALTWAVRPGPVDQARWVVLRAVAGAALAGILAGSGDRGWWARPRRVPAALVVLAAGLAALGGLRGAARAGAVGGALADGVRTRAGAVVLVVAVLLALAVSLVGDGRLAGAHALAAGWLALAAAGGDLVRWWGEHRPGPVGILAARTVLAVLAGVVGLALLRAGRVRSRTRQVTDAGPASGP